MAVTWDSTATAVNNYGHFSPVPQKYIDKVPGAQDGAEEPNFILIRYADVLLSLAEAINEVEHRLRQAVPSCRVIYIEPDIERSPENQTAVT